MPDSASPPKLVRFGNFEVDLPAGHLRKHGIKLKLADQSFEVLAILLEHAGEVVTREDLRRRLWPEDVFVDFDNNLNTAIARLREALSDSANHPLLIETLPRRGYRFVASLSQPAPAIPRLLVLPFANLSGDPAQEYFSDAMTEEIIGALAGLAPDHLAVIARTTAMHYKGSQKDITQIGRELAVDYVVEGSVRRLDDRIVVSVQLIQVSDQTHLWTNRYDSELRDLFSMESAAAQAIAGQLGIAPRRAARKSTEDLAVYNLYIQGRYHLFKGTPEDMAKAKLYLEEAIARDPEFALAYDSLAEIYWYWGFLGFAPPREACSAGMFCALRAVEIDNTLAETHALLGMYRKELDYAWPEVQREMGLALQLNPASPLVRTRYAVSGLLPHGRIEEAIAEMERAVELDPLSPFIRIWLGIMLWLGRDYDGAIEQAQMLLELDPASYMSHFAAGLYYREKGMFEEAIAAHRRSVELSGGSPLMLGWLGLALAQSGKTAEARAILDRLHMIAREAYVPPTSFAWIHLGLGERDDAFLWMDRAVDGRDHMMGPLKTYPFLDPIRADPRYLALLRKLNLEA
jgi:TolB-like protein